MLPQAATIAPSPLGKGAGLRWRPLPQAEAPTELRVSSGHLAKRSNDRGGSRERQARRRVADTMTEGVVRLRADGKVLLCRQRYAAVGFKPLQSRAFYVAALPRRWLARDSFPINGEAKGASVFRTRSQKENFLALSEGGEGGSAQSALTGEV